jgi:uncharacterized protein YqhQ
MQQKKIDFAVGGQAVIEGVMMRSPNFITVAVRKENGTIKLKTEPFKSISAKIKFLGKPIIRGITNLIEMMVIGFRIINYSASESLEETEVSDKPEGKWDKAVESISFILSILFALTFSIFLFKFIPLWITEWLSTYLGMLEQYYFIYNFVDGIIKTSIFVLYIALLTLIPSIMRVFQYHGAEHKSIFAYEKGLDLTVENAKIQSRFHPRCGTSFILIVFVISILIYTVVPKQEDFIANFLLRLLFLPIIAGFSYEFLKWSAKKQKSFWVNLLVAPGLLFQKLTTSEPDDKQLEVALNALQSAVDLEKEAENKKTNDIQPIIDVP